MEQKDWDGTDRRTHCADHCDTIDKVKGMVQWKVFAGSMGAVIAAVGIFATIYTKNIESFEVAIKEGFVNLKLVHNRDLDKFHNEYLRDVIRFTKIAEANRIELRNGAKDRARIEALQRVVLHTIELDNGHSPK